MITGSLVALVTPMHTDFEVNYDALRLIVDLHCCAGTSAIVVAGTTGEATTLDVKEQAGLISFVAEVCKGRIPVVAGVGANSTKEAIELSAMAKDSGAVAGLAVVPYYVKPNQAGMIRHFEAVARATSFPQILYNIPSRTSVDMRNETVLHLAQDTLIIGIKDATSDFARAAELMAAAPPHFAFYSGDDATTLPYILLGGHGTISVAANVVPGLMARMCERARAGDLPAARTQNARLLPLYDALAVDTNPIPVKYALATLGFMADALRLPLVSLDPSRRAIVDAALEALVPLDDAMQGALRALKSGRR